MKQLFLILSSILFTGAAFEDTSCQCLCPCHSNQLIEILVGETSLTMENILQGRPIYPSEIINRINPDGAVHRAIYLHGTVITFIPTIDGSNYGMQVVCFNVKSDGGTNVKESRSKSWNVETFNGKKYVVHYHDGFCVYSSKDEQFVIAR